MYSNAFELAVNHIMLYEIGGFWNINAVGARDGTNDRACGYTNDPNDAGGETKYGISKNKNPNVDVTNLNWDGAKAVYYKNYWIIGHCDKLPGRIAALHFDGCVNNGVVGATRFLQRSVNVDDDGIMGTGTIAAINTYNEIGICNAICDQRVQYYTDIVARKPAQSMYLTGWLRRIEEMRTFTTNPSNNFQ